MAIAKKTARKTARKTAAPLSASERARLHEALTQLVASAALLRAGVREMQKKHRRGEREEVANAFPEFDHALREMGTILGVLATSLRPKS